MIDKLIQNLIAANSRLLKSVALMPDKEVVDKWSKGEKPNSFRYSINGYNKKSVEKRKDKAISIILKEMQLLHKKWIEQIKKLDDKQVTDFHGTMLGKKQINLLWMINEAISHDNAHAKELEKKYK